MLLLFVISTRFAVYKSKKTISNVSVKFVSLSVSSIVFTVDYISDELILLIADLNLVQCELKKIFMYN